MKKMTLHKIFLALVDVFFIAIGSLITNYIMSRVIPNYVVSYKHMMYIILLNSLFCFLVLYAIGSYSRTWKSIGYKDYLFCALGMFAGQFLSILVLFLLGKNPSKLVFLVDFIISTAGAVLFRAVFKQTFMSVYKAGSHGNTKGVRTLIIGAGQAAQMILDEISSAKYDDDNISVKYEVVGLVDDDRGKSNSKVKGIRVLGTTNDIPKIVSSANIEQIIFAIPSCSEKDRKRILEICSKTKCKIKVIPFLGNLIFDEDHTELISQAKDIKIEDLLGREPIKFDKQNIKAELARLDAFNAITTLSIDGVQTAPFTLEISKPKKQKNGEHISALIEQRSIDTLVKPYKRLRALTAAEISEMLKEPEKLRAEKQNRNSILPLPEKSKKRQDATSNAEPEWLREWKYYITNKVAV